MADHIPVVAVQHVVEVRKVLLEYKIIMLITLDLVKAADRALNALQTMRKGMQGDLNKKKRLRSELASAFPSTGKKAKKCAWKHRFVCLARHDQMRIPTTENEKDNLFEAGLGEKCIEFASLDVDGEQFRDILYSSFPKLPKGGGFQLCRCVPNSRQLEPLTAVVHSSPSLLKERVGNARTYIRPLQRDLDMDIVSGLPEGVSTCSIYLIILVYNDCEIHVP